MRNMVHQFELQALWTLLFCSHFKLLRLFAFEKTSEDTFLGKELVD